MRLDYHKLVRDGIPRIIETEGGRPVTRVLGQAGYMAALRAKLIEEAEEAQAASDSQLRAELADVLEVLQALAIAQGMTWEDVVVEATRKRGERGGFDQRIFLEYVDRLNTARGADRALNDRTTPGQAPKQARLPSGDLRLCQAWLPGQNGRCQNRPPLHLGQLRSSLTTRLFAANGAASALSRAGLPMQAVPALSALLVRRARPSPPASPGAGRPRRHATERGTRQDQPQSRQTLSYSAASQSTRIVPLYPPASGLEVQSVPDFCWPGSASGGLGRGVEEYHFAGYQAEPR
jgi:predicted house-cleaning noncanonical NTP pyrophosphatase (MazG superfamily)